MTYIQISSSHEDLEAIESLSMEIFRKNGIAAKTQISVSRADSIEAEQFLPVLSVTFGGVIAIVQIVNLILNIQDRKSKAVVEKETPISIKIRAINGKELDFKISGNATELEIKKYLNDAQKFVSDFLQDDDGISLKNSQEEAISSRDIEKINLLFRGLLSNLTDIREKKSSLVIPDEEVRILNLNFNKTSLKEFIYKSRDKKIYLRHEEAQACKGFFYVLERENVLALHESNTDFCMVDMEDIFVRYEIEELSLFSKVVHHKDFILNSIDASNSSVIATYAGNKISILLLAADPSDASRLRLGEEFREIQDKLQLAKLREQFILNQRMSVRPTDLSQLLLDLQPQIVHFSGHGLASGELCFENEVGQSHPISPSALSALFEQFEDHVKCVLLNACYSENQAIAISKHIDHVIGMNKAIGDKAAIAFATGFYQALGSGRTIREAYNLGCVQIMLRNIPEHLSPVFLERSRSN